jgi:hypothetical protein
MSLWWWGRRDGAGKRPLFSASVPIAFLFATLVVLVASLLVPLFLRSR